MSTQVFMFVIILHESQSQTSEVAYVFVAILPSMYFHCGNHVSL